MTSKAKMVAYLDLDIDGNDILLLLLEHDGGLNDISLVERTNIEAAHWNRRRALVQELEQSLQRTKGGGLDEHTLVVLVQQGVESLQIFLNGLLQQSLECDRQYL